MQIRELQRQLALAPFEGRWRIALLPEFQRASHSAANALLKTLEEPPDQVLLLLTAPAAESLLPTIVSACKAMDVTVEPPRASCTVSALWDVAAPRRSPFRPIP